MFKKAFTLIELLIVIVIIGILATALIPRFTGAQNKARYARVEKDFRDFRTAVFMAQSNTNKPLKDITGEGCTFCVCGTLSGSTRIFNGINFQNLSNNTTCRQKRLDALRKIEQASGMSSGSLASLETDPWGAPYLLDENEGEHGTTGCDAQDRIYTVGPDGFNEGGDDKLIKLAPMGCPGAY